MEKDSQDPEVPHFQNSQKATNKTENSIDINEAEIETEDVNLFQCDPKNRFPPSPSYSFREIDNNNPSKDESFSEESESESESEEDNLERSLHFFLLAKNQYETILKNEPNNNVIRERLNNLLNSNQHLLQYIKTQSPGENFEERSKKKRKKK